MTLNPKEGAQDEMKAAKKYLNVFSKFIKERILLSWRNDRARVPSRWVRWVHDMPAAARRAVNDVTRSSSAAIRASVALAFVSAFPLYTNMNSA